MESLQEENGMLREYVAGLDEERDA